MLARRFSYFYLYSITDSHIISFFPFALFDQSEGHKLERYLLSVDLSFPSRFAPIHVLHLQKHHCTCKDLFMLISTDIPLINTSYYYFVKGSSISFETAGLLIYRVILHYSYMRWSRVAVAAFGE